MILNNEIIEYDIEHAGPSILYNAKAISKELYEELISLDKKTRVVKTGLLIKDNPRFYDIIQAGYKKYTDKFINENKLRPDQVSEVVHDAVWLSGVIPEITVFDKTIKFRKKRTHSMSYVYERKNIRLYYNFLTDTVDIRGGSFSNNKKFLNIIKRILKLFENGNKDTLYNQIHNILIKLKKDENYYGCDLINGLKNMTLIKALLKDLIIY